MRFREPWVRLLWVFALFLLQLRILNLWQFVSDDGHTLLAALDFLEGPARWTWLGPTSSVGARHPPFVYFVWSLLLRLHFSLTTVQVGILLQQAAAHWLLIGIGTRLRGPAAGYFASALYFLAPSFYAEYSLRFWEPAGLPLATMFGLYCAVKLVDDSRGSWLPVACAAALFATGGHLNALMLFPALGAIALENRRRIRWKCWQIVVAGLLAFLALIPVFTWKKAGYYVPPGTGIAVALGLILVGCFFHFPKVPSRVLTLAIAALTIYFLWAVPEKNDPVRCLAGLLSPFRSEMPAHHGAPFAEVSNWGFFPEAALFALFLLRLGIVGEWHANGERVLFWWLAVPFSLLLLEGFFPFRYYSYWQLFLFPAAFLAPACAAAWLLEKLRPIALRRSVAMAGLALCLGLNGWQSWRLEQFMRESHGVANFLSNLGTKLAVMDRISESPGVPNISEMIIPYRRVWYMEFDAWNFLRLYYLRREWAGRTEPGKYFYVHQENGTSSEPGLVEVIRAAKGVKEERIGSVTLFTSDFPVDGAGWLVR